MLAVIGSGEYLVPMAAVDRQLLELFETPPRVVCLPTAAGREGDEKIDDWMHRGAAYFTSLGADAEPVRVWDRDSANDPSLAERIASADFVYLSGGRPSYLHDTLNGSLAWHAITSVVERGGLLAGCSAGAMIQGERFAGLHDRTADSDSGPGRTSCPLRRTPVTVGRDDATPGRQAIHTRRRRREHRTRERRRRISRIGDQVTIWTTTAKRHYGPGDLPVGALDRGVPSASRDGSEHDGGRQHVRCEEMTRAR
ncbi:MAG: Type 1 glutamine amidotransferase-like domain-containing protein [Ilumatobacteraceae bacterium]